LDEVEIVDKHNKQKHKVFDDSLCACGFVEPARPCSSLSWLGLNGCERVCFLATTGPGFLCQGFFVESGYLAYS